MKATLSSTLGTVNVRNLCCLDIYCFDCNFSVNVFLTCGMGKTVSMLDHLWLSQH